MIKIKNIEQIEGIRRSSVLAAKTLDYITPFVTIGTSTQEIDERIETFIRDNGAIPATFGYLGYPASSCISINEVVCHGVPGPRVLEEGDIVNIDVTTILDGYYGDTSRMYAIGVISEESKRLLCCTKEALFIGINQVYPGNYFGNIGYAIQQHASRNGFSVVYEFCGHGVGLQFHEQPQINHSAPKDSGELMEEGMVFTIEPMYNTLGPTTQTLSDGWTVTTTDGGISAQYEHTILVTKNGYEILTTA